MTSRSLALLPLLAALLLLPAMAPGEEDLLPTTHAAAVHQGGVVTFQSSLLDFEDGSHFVMLSSVKGLEGKGTWRSIAPGETRLLFLIRGDAKAGTIVFPEFDAEDLKAMFSMGKEAPGPKAGGLLITNKTKETLKLKEVFKGAINDGKYLCKSGAITLHEGAKPKKALSADFALLFDKTQVAGQLRLTK